MRILPWCLSLLYLFGNWNQAQGQNVYLPPSPNAQFPRATEYFSYNAPAEDAQAPLQVARQLAGALTPPRKVVFIRSPETNIYTLTAKQLAVRNPLDIYVLQRQTDPATLEQQRLAIEKELARKPSVHFVKYRTPADVTRALATLRSDYDQLPGSSHIYSPQTADVFELRKPAQLPAAVSQPLPLPTPPPSLPSPVIFKILPRGEYEYKEMIEMAKVQALFQPYLPPARRR